MVQDTRLSTVEIEGSNPSFPTKAVFGNLPTALQLDEAVNLENRSNFYPYFMPYKDTHKQRRYHRQRHADKQEAIRLDKKWKGCAVCGLRDVVVLEYHHIDPVQKCFSPGRGRGRPSHKALQDEIDKCVVLCANDHLRVEAGIIVLGDIA